MSEEERIKEEAEEEGIVEECLVGVEAKWRGEVIPLPQLDINTSCVRDLKMLISEITCIPIKRIKLLGPFGSAGTSENDVVMLNEFNKKIKKGKFVLTVMGTPNEELDAFEKAGEVASSSGVLNDFGHNFTPASKEWHNLKKFTENCEINFIQEPRPGKKLLVLDLDHTILDFSSQGKIATDKMKRPHMEAFLEKMYEHYDIAIWSQTHWKWVEIKLIELGIINNPKFKLCFMLDKASMFRSGDQNKYIKPLHIIWSKFPNIWGKHNTLHIDDLERNFAMNPENGVLCSAYYRDCNSKKPTDSAPSVDDNELILLMSYLIDMAKKNDVSKVDHQNWRDHASSTIRNTIFGLKGGNCNSTFKSSS